MKISNKIKTLVFLAILSLGFSSLNSLASGGGGDEDDQAELTAIAAAAAAEQVPAGTGFNACVQSLLEEGKAPVCYVNEVRGRKNVRRVFVVCKELLCHFTPFGRFVESSQQELPHGERTVLELNDRRVFAITFMDTGKVEKSVQKIVERGGAVVNRLREGETPQEMVGKLVAPATESASAAVAAAQAGDLETAAAQASAAQTGATALAADLSSRKDDYTNATGTRFFCDAREGAILFEMKRGEDGELIITPKSGRAVLDNGDAELLKAFIVAQTEAAAE